MGEIEVHVHPVDFDAVKAYYAERGVIPARLKLVPHPTQRWLREPASGRHDRYSEIE